MKNWPPPIMELTFTGKPIQGGKPPNGKLTFGRLRTHVNVTVQKPGRGFYPQRTKKQKTVKHKSRYGVLRVIDAHSMEVVEHYMGSTQYQNSDPVRIEGLPTAGAVEEISEINIGGKFFEDRGMLYRSNNSNEKIRVLRFLQ